MDLLTCELGMLAAQDLNPLKKFLAAGCRGIVGIVGHVSPDSEKS